MIFLVISCSSYRLWLASRCHKYLVQYLFQNYTSTVPDTRSSLSAVQIVYMHITYCTIIGVLNCCASTNSTRTPVKKASFTYFCYRHKKLYKQVQIAVPGWVSILLYLIQYRTHYLLYEVLVQRAGWCFVLPGTGSTLLRRTELVQQQGYMIYTLLYIYICWNLKI